MDLESLGRGRLSSHKSTIYHGMGSGICCGVRSFDHSGFAEVPGFFWRFYAWFRLTYSGSRVLEFLWLRPSCPICLEFFSYPDWLWSGWFSLVLFVDHQGAVWTCSFIYRRAGSFVTESWFWVYILYPDPQGSWMVFLFNVQRITMDHSWWRS